MLIEDMRLLGLRRKTGYCHSYSSSQGTFSIFAPVPQAPNHTRYEEGQMTTAHAVLALQERNSEHREPGYFFNGR